MKYSKQRELVLQTVKDNSVHPTADFVYNQLKAQNPNISLGTVYRNLNILSQTGEIIKIITPGSCDRFDGKTDKHYHFHCTGCDSILDIPIEQVFDSSFNPNNIMGHEIKEHYVIFSGICKDCKKYEKQ